MANLIRRDNGNKQTQITRDPLQWMRDMLQWDPFAESAPASFFGPGWEGNFNPAFEVKETKDAFQINADMPGVKENDVEVKMTGNRLSISGKRDIEKEDKNDTYYTFERSYGSFQRLFTLPDGVDTEHSVAELKDGVLTIVLPKKPGTGAKTIEVKAGSKPKS